MEKTGFQGGDNKTVFLCNFKLKSFFGICEEFCFFLIKILELIFESFKFQKSLQKVLNHH